MKLAVDLGRPRKRSPEENLILSFQVGPDLIAALDGEAARQTAEQPSGRAKVSRTDIVRQALHEWLEARGALKPKKRSK